MTLLGMDLPTVWFLLLTVLAAGYAILDGFDLGAGVLHFCARTDRERRILLNAVGPVWDGNEVWLVTAGGALFAAFPEFYATLASGFYMAVILLLLALIMRGIAIEFRSKEDFPGWRPSWDVCYTAGSGLIAFLLGVVIGNLVRGLPLDARGEYAGGFLDLLSPYALLVGATAVALFAQHGGFYLVLKTEGDLQDRLRRWTARAGGVFLLLYAATTLATLAAYPHMTARLRAFPVLWVLPVLHIGLMAWMHAARRARRDGAAFTASALVVGMFLVLFALGVYPYLLRSRPEIAHSLTVYTAASSEKTLLTMLIITGIGIPLVLAYTGAVYWIFRGKVRLEEGGY